MSQLYSGAERRSGLDRRQEERRIGGRFAYDAWRFNGHRNLREGSERRSGVERRGRSVSAAVLDQPSPPIFLSTDKIAAAVHVIEERQLQVAYQPIYELKSGKVFGYEALARVESPVFENLIDLFHAASEAGRVAELGRLHRTQAVSQCPMQPLFINIFPTEFDYGLLVRPDDAIFRHQWPIYLEITESLPLSHFDQCREVISELRLRGMLLAIDDLGAGYSNLKYIADLAPDIVKLDRDLIVGVQEGYRQAKLVRALVRLCKEMGARVVAEGIETIDELIVAERAGVDFCQGYLLGRPAALPKGEAWPGFR
jgi:EAL domain-containing protein (putative c-di-GMP-specific phosphodiesterase class I)